MRTYGRRRLLAAVGAGLTGGVAGCAGGPAADGDGGDDTPAPVEPPDGADYALAVEHPDPPAADWEPPRESPLDAGVAVEPVVENLEVPWDLSVAGDGTVFLSERPGRISRYASGRLEAVTEPADVIDHATAVDVDGEGGWWAGGGEGGLLGIAAHPNYPDVPVVYAFYTYEAGEDDLRNRLVYYDLRGGEATERTVIDGIPGNDYHNGARLAFGPQNYLWVTTGDAGEGSLSQDAGSVAGKVLRLKPDGSAPADNPDGGDPRVYSLGHRNPQSVDFLPDGTPIVSEHGEAGGDEVLLPAAGENHGWPEARSADEYAGSEFARPLVNTGPGETWAPSGGSFYTGDALPAWRNRFVVGGLGSQQVVLVTPYPAGEIPDLDDGTTYAADWMDPAYDAVAHRVLAGELGRVRHVQQGRDGALYALTSNRDGRASDGFPREGDDRLVRLGPA